MEKPRTDEHITFKDKYISIHCLLTLNLFERVKSRAR